jgi:hypothetical protein
MGELTRFRTLRNPSSECGRTPLVVAVTPSRPSEVLADLRVAAPGQDILTGADLAGSLTLFVARWRDGGLQLPPEAARPFALVADLARWLACHPADSVDQLLLWLVQRLAESDIVVKPEGAFAAVVSSGDWDALVAWLEDELLVRLADASAAALTAGARVVPEELADPLNWVIGLLRVVRLLVAFASNPLMLDRAELDLRVSAAVVLPSPPFPILLPPALAGPPVIADLYVVRDEWARYVAGEFAFIENVMPGEERERSTRTTNRTEVLVETETTETERTRRETYESDRTTEADESSRQTSLEIGLQFNNDLTVKYGAVENNTKIGASLAFSRTEASRRATEIARESGRRAVQETEKQVRQLRRETVATTVSELDLHRLSNKDTDAVRGVYRWVERIQRYQLFRYPHRLQLEFYLPEPGKFLQQLLDDRTSSTAAIPVPDPLFLTEDGTEAGTPITISSIEPDNYLDIAHALGVADPPVPPEPELFITESLALSAGQRDKEIEVWEVLPFPPVVAGTKDVQLPDGYHAVAWSASAAAAPELASWKDHTDWNDTGDGVDEKIGYHSIVVGITVGGTNVVIRNKVEFTFPLPIGTIPELNTVHVGHADYRDRWLAGNAFWLDAQGQPTSTAKFAQPLEGKLSFGATMGGSYSGTASVTLACEPTDTAMAAWRTDVYSQLSTAVAARDQQIRAAEAANRTEQADEVRRGISPSVRRVLLRQELKRQVLECLQGEHFIGFDDAPVGADANNVQRPLVAFDQALAHAPFVRFFEQSFEWENLMYVLYPTYWSSSSTWQRLVDLDVDDLELRNFLDAGAARVLVPARPKFESGVYTFLELGLVVPGDTAMGGSGALSMSVAEEVMAMTRPPADGEPGESWEAGVPTAMLWLDTGLSLPVENDASTLDPPSP